MGNLRTSVSGVAESVSGGWRGDRLNSTCGSIVGTVALRPPPQAQSGSLPRVNAREVPEPGSKDSGPSVLLGKEGPGQCANPAAYPPAPPLEVDDRALVGSEMGSQLSLGESAPPSTSPEALPEPRPNRLGVVAEEPDDSAVLPGQRPGASGFPEMNGLLPHLQPNREGSLRQPEVEPPAPDVVTQSAEDGRITSGQGLL